MGNQESTPRKEDQHRDRFLIRIGNYPFQKHGIAVSDRNLVLDSAAGKSNTILCRAVTPRPKPDSYSFYQAQ
ncbi:MAG TPA: hypothetical protein DCG12_09820 [Planctomycetaceae bacterium]|nr:hypothetical protein [Planctomycetaceae bacterium]